MTWMLTSQGRVLSLAAPLTNATALSLPAIAHSLATVNRYTGHAARPISVAEHSLLVCDIVDREMHLGAHAQMAALMHDAHECITNDLSTPAKGAVGPAWRAFEDAHENAVHVFFGLRLHFEAYGAAIKHADLVAMATERRDLLPPGGPEWPVLRGIDPLPHIHLRERDGFTWQDWRAAFIDRFQELEYACNELAQGRRP